MIDRTRVRWIFFDVGDTLLDEQDSMSDWCRQVAEILPRFGRTVTAADVWNARQNAYAEMAPIVLRRLFDLLSVNNDDASAVLDLAKYNHAMEQPFPGTSDVLKNLAARFKLGVIANQAEGTAQRLCGHGWEDIFSVCISSTEAGLRKPDPAIFHLALKEANCAAENAVMIGDRIDNDIAPAKSLGMQTIRLKQGMSRYQNPRSPTEEPHATLSSIIELPPLLL